MACGRAWLSRRLLYSVHLGYSVFSCTSCTLHRTAVLPEVTLSPVMMSALYLLEVSVVCKLCSYLLVQVRATLKTQPYLPHCQRCSMPVAYFTAARWALYLSAPPAKHGAAVVRQVRGVKGAKEQDAGRHSVR